jgi:hypothetical protein
MSDLAASPSPKRPVLAVSYPQKIWLSIKWSNYIVK